ncbi:hypothetical protein QR680_015966 [Steinernema hermaphroditum]|uniref:BPTI/Kunitz inhibitor domain-containing protein n=1 Tax=Steinernema hermaphroditum TaxID=289476 RepID=A0AA39LLT3_9BILA|nr:hypothetical protein QR680_015966 [Steinernema hermaphroditum]
MPSQVRIRHWNKFSFMFARKGDAERQKIPVELASRSTTTATSKPRPPSECLMQIPDTLFFRGFMQPFYTYDSKIMTCTIIYGVTVRHKAPNVFSSLEACQARCSVLHSP